MKTLWEFLGFCNHTWKIISKGTITNEFQRECGNWYVSQCEKCGKIKQNNFLA